jgi:hypothetical protein
VEGSGVGEAKVALTALPANSFGANRHRMCGLTG